MNRLGVPVPTYERMPERRSSIGEATLRVLCLTNMYPTESDPSTGSFVRELVEEVRRLGVHVEVLAFDGRRRKRRYAEAAVLLRRALRDGRFDLVHAHYGLTGMVALSQRRVPTLVTFHGSDTGYVRWQGWVSWLVARCATPVFVSRDGARRLGCPDAAVIPAGADLARFRPRPASEARRALGWAESGHIVLFPGSRSNERKDARLFDSVVKELRRYVPDVRTVSLEGFSRSQVVDVMNAVDLMLDDVGVRRFAGGSEGMSRLCDSRRVRSGGRHAGAAGRAARVRDRAAGPRPPGRRGSRSIRV